MLNFHNSIISSFTILGTEATEKQSTNYGCIVEDKITHEVLHYVGNNEIFLISILNQIFY
jgi:mannose-1-phosphate guanylyltransferase